MHIDLINLSIEDLNFLYGTAWLVMHLKIWTLRNSSPFGFKAKVFFLWIVTYYVSVLLCSNLNGVQMIIYQIINLYIRSWDNWYNIKICKMEAADGSNKDYETPSVVSNWQATKDTSSVRISKTIQHLFPTTDGLDMLNEHLSRSAFWNLTDTLIVSSV